MLAKSKLSSLEVLISKALIDLNISHDEFISINNMLKVNTENKNPKFVKIKTGKIMVTSNCAVCCSKKKRFVKAQEASRLLSNLGIKTFLSQIPIVGPILF